MPTKRRPKKGWRPLGLLDVLGIFSEHEMAAVMAPALAAQCPGRPSLSDRPHDQETLKAAVCEAAALLRYDLNDEAGPVPAEVMAALEVIDKQAKALNDSLATLDDTTRRRLGAASAGRPLDWGAPRSPLSVSVGPYDLLVANTISRLADLRAWAKFAAGWVPPTKRGTSGRRRHDATRKAVAVLRDAWRETVGEPTLTSARNGKTTGPFLTFVRAALKPAAPGHKAVANLEKIVHESLYT